MANSAVQTFTHKGVTLNYTIQGEGVPVLVIGSHLYYPRTFSSNLHAHVQFIFMNHRGFSPSIELQDPEAFELERLLEDVEALRQHLNLTQMIVLGHSIHALMAIEYAKKHPAHVKGLALIASSPMAGETLHHQANQYFQESVSSVRKALMSQNLAVLQREIAENPEGAFVTRMVRFGPMLWYNPEFNASHLWEGVTFHPVGAQIVWGPMFAHYNLATEVNIIEIPTFLALGRYDYFNPYHLWEPVRDKFKQLTVRVFERSGHTPQYEEPETFKTEFLEWTLQKI